MHPFVELAKKAVEEYIRTGTVAPPPKDLPEEMRKQAGVFVSLKKNGQLRGCIGTFMPSADTLYKEITRNAVSAAVEDPRFPAVHESELSTIQYSVDVLSPPEQVSSREHLDPKRYGIIVTKEFRRGLLLPDLQGVDTVEDQLRITKMKAGIDPSDEDIQIFRFTVQRYR